MSGDFRNLRKSKVIRDSVAETAVSVADLIMPYFVIEGTKRREPIKSMPGISRLSIDNLLADVKAAKSLGIEAVLLFGVTDKKDEKGRESYRPDGVLQRAVKALKKDVEDIVVITDVCMCGYTSHSHCGIVKNSYVDNDATIKVLAKIAVSHAAAGADFVAPSAMMDGQVAAIREALDKNGFGPTGIFAYSAKYASSLYGPFRDALGSSPKFGDRKTYQMDYRNSDEALREIGADIEEGADIVMVKPALFYLDIMRRAKDAFKTPLAAYNVGGEYSMVKAYMSSEFIVRSSETEKNLVLEVLTSIKRAGADLIITYHAKDVAKWLKS